MKKITLGILILTLCFLGGCKPQPYIIEEQKQKEITVSKGSYLLANRKLRLIEKSEYEEAKTVYYVVDEKDLAQALIYNIQEGENKVAYQSDNKIDIDKTANYLSYIEPYDLSLQVSSTDYTDQQGNLIYKSNVVEIKNLDERYGLALDAAQQVYKEIIHTDMDNDQKIEAIHDYLAKTTTYKDIPQELSKEYPNVFTAAGSLIDKNAVCAGYARAFLMLAKLAEVPAIYVASDTINHGWNLVYGNDGWRYIDVTWDDPIPDIFNHAEHKFLNMTIDEFIKERSHVFDVDKSSDYFLEIAEIYFNKYQTEN